MIIPAKYFSIDSPVIAVIIIITNIIVMIIVIILFCYYKIVRSGSRSNSYQQYLVENF